MTLTEELIQTFNQLDKAHQQELLAYARSMIVNEDKVKGESGKSIVNATGFFDLDALDEIESAINDANRIDWHG